MRTLILLLLSCSAFGQSYIPFATGRTTDTGKTTGSILIPYVLRLPSLASSDTNKVLGVTANGTLELRTKTIGLGTVTSITPAFGFTSTTPITSSGSLTVDSTKFASVHANSLKIPYSDTSVNVITRTYANTNLWRVNGNSLGAAMVGGTIDSNNLKHIVYNITVDSVSRGARVGYFMNSNAESSRIFTNLSTGGAVQSNGVLIGIGRGTQYTSNIPFIQLGGTTASTTQPAITQEAFFFSTIGINPPNSTSTTTAIYGSGRALNAINSINYSFGTLIGGGHVTATSGTLNLFGLGYYSGLNGGFSPTTGSCQRFVLSDVGLINQTGSASATTGTLTNKDITLTLATDYRFCHATNNSGTAYSSSGTAKSTLLGNLIIGSTTDNGNPLQITNGSIYASTMSAGAISDSLLVLDNSTKVYKKYKPINKIIDKADITLSSGGAIVSNTSVLSGTSFSYSILDINGSVAVGVQLQITPSAGVGYIVNSVNAAGVTETADVSIYRITIFY